jgi:hypothetical protein
MTKFNTAEDQAVELNKSEELADNQVKLSDGRIIEIRETTGADEIVVAAELGDTFGANGGGAVIFQSCLMAKSISKIDGLPNKPIRDFGEYRDFLSSFRSKDWNKIRELYQKLNGDDEKGNGLGAR